MKRRFPKKSKLAPKKKSKYGNKKVTVDGITYDSVGESQRHSYLKLLEKTGEIKDLRYHVMYELIPPIEKETVVHLKTKDKTVTKVVQKARHYEADFVYIVKKTGEEVVEDYKGQETQLFKFKAALFHYIYKKPIRVVKQVNEPIY